MFKKYLSKLYIRAYKEIYTEVSESFEAVPIDVSSYIIILLVIRLETLLKGLSDTRVVIRPKESFITRINELMDCNTQLEIELE